jgi:hypothetical protein
LSGLIAHGFETELQLGQRLIARRDPVDDPVAIVVHPGLEGLFALAPGLPLG